ncbi:MAG: M60 family metallopeptidase [Ardenticatenales bacterium]
MLQPSPAVRPLMVRLAAAAIVAAVMGIGSVSVPVSKPATAADTVAIDRQNLLTGVQFVQSSPGSIPGPVIPFGDAFPVVLAAEGERRMPVVSAVRWAQGRVVAFGHGGFFDVATLDDPTTQSKRFFVNAITWSAAGRKAIEDMTIVVEGHADLQAWLTAQGATVVPSDGGDMASKLRGADVLVWGAWTQDAAERDAIAGWVKGGGGLVAESLGWGWMQLNPTLDIRQHAGNQLLAQAGLVWSDGYLDRTSGNPAGFATGITEVGLTQGTRALEALRDQLGTLDPRQVAQAVHLLTRLIRTLPRDEGSLLPELRRMTADLGPIVPTEADPVSLLTDPLQRIGLTLQVEDLRFAPPGEAPFHPAGAEFPGDVPPSAPRVQRTVSIDTRQTRWHSTGLYAPPGEKLTVTLPDSALDLGLALRIGAFTDENWHMDDWTRVPSIWSRHPLDAATTFADNAFGGPVYIEVPDDISFLAGTIDVHIAGAVEAPYFRLGETTVAEWRDRLRGLEAPYAELGTDKIFLTVPSSAIRGLDDPEPVLRFWNEVADAQADLAQRPRERDYPERYVADRQIGYGYMHAGYPIMTFTDVKDLVVDEATLRREGSWGHFHELGHNHQQSDWTFDGTGEVTVNLFTVYTYDHVLGMKSQFGGPGNMARLTPDAIRATWEAYDRAGRKFSDWKADPFLALSMYIQLEQAFGWQSYMRVFAEYRALTDDQRPKNDDEKRDQWMFRFSRQVNRNLCPFFALWGVPVSQQACDNVADLPAWDPWTERLATATPTPFSLPTVTSSPGGPTPTSTRMPSPGGPTVGPGTATAGAGTATGIVVVARVFLPIARRD